MSKILDYRPNTPLKWLSIDIPPNFNASKVPRYYEHSPHPQKARHIVGLEGEPICIVQTKDVPSHKVEDLIFPPNNFNERKIQSHYNQWISPYEKNSGVLITSGRLDFDQVNSLKYFTGLRNISFNDKRVYKLDPMKQTAGWQKELDDIINGAFQPILKDKSLEAAFKTTLLPAPREIRPSQRTARQLYSSSGRIIPSRSSRTSIKSSRTSTARNVHSRAGLNRPLSSIQEPTDFNEDPIKQQIFYILGGILQTTDPEIIKTWLLTATEREKSLITDIVRSALIDKEELKHFVKETEKEPTYKLIVTPQPSTNKKDDRKSRINAGTSTSQEINSLVLDPIDFTPENHPAINTKSPVLQNYNDLAKKDSRPTTSSTFRPKTQESKLDKITEGPQWIPGDSTAK